MIGQTWSGDGRWPRHLRPLRFRVHAFQARLSEPDPVNLLAVLSQKRHVEAVSGENLNVRF